MVILKLLLKGSLSAPGLIVFDIHEGAQGLDFQLFELFPLVMMGVLGGLLGRVRVSVRVSWVAS